MSNLKKEVKQWMKATKRNRFWLAEKCFVSKKTVDDWFTSRGTIPPIKLALIQKLMDETPQSDNFEGETSVRITFTDEEQKIVDRFRKLFPGVNIEKFLRGKLIELGNVLSAAEDAMNRSKKK